MFRLHPRRRSANTSGAHGRFLLSRQPNPHSPQRDNIQNGTNLPKRITPGVSFLLTRTARLSRVLRYAIFGMLPLHWACTPNPPKKATTPEYSYSSPSTGNVAHDMLLAKTSGVRAFALAHIVTSSGDRCTGTKAFFMGLNPKDNEAYWSVGCTNGKSYEVAIKANATGSTSVVDCAVMKTIAHVSCFQKLDQQ